MGQLAAQPWFYFYDQQRQGSLWVHQGTTASRKPSVWWEHDSSQGEEPGRATGGTWHEAPPTRKTVTAVMPNTGPSQASRSPGGEPVG